MLDFIIKYWIEIFLTSVTTGTVYIIKQYFGLRNGMKSLLRNEIIRIYEKYSILGFCPSYMKENINEMYTNYHKLKGNGMVTSMVNEIFKLPNGKRRRFIMKEKLLTRIIELLKVKSIITILSF